MFVRKNVFRTFVSLSLPFLLSACNSPVVFSSEAVDERVDTPLLPLNPDRPTPVPQPEPPPVDEPTPEVPPSHEFSQGLCSPDSSTRLTSCMNCEVPQVKVEPQLSRKGRELLQIMTEGCAITNKSDPAGYKPPTREELLNRLQQCSPHLYPDTTFKETQRSTTSALTAEDDSIRRKIFSDIFYKVPWSDDFGTYFGIEVVEARYLFCYRSGHLPEYIYPRGWHDSYDWPRELPPLYVEANQIRRNLKNCMEESIRTPYVPPVPEPGYTCKYETMSGPNDDAVFTKVATWLSQGYKVGYESAAQGLCGAVNSASDIIEVDGDIHLGAYKCQRDQ